MNKFYQKEVESSVEYILPDYLGDVKKVLSVSASAVPSGRFAGEGSVEFSGIVVYNVLYADADGEFTKLAVTSDYDFAVSDANDGYVDSMAYPKVINAAVRFTGPRKLVAKSLVSNSIMMIVKSDAGPTGNVFDEGKKPEVDMKNIKEENLIFTSSLEREYAEEAERLPGVSADGIEILATSGAVIVYESVAEDGGVRVKGDIIITSIIKTDDQPPFAIRRAVPFDELVTLEGAIPNMQTMANGYLTSVSTGLAEDAEGTAITVNAIAEFTCCASENKDVSVMTDAYLKERDTEAQYENYTYCELICMDNCESEFSVSASRAELGCEDIREILSVSCELEHAKKSITSRGVEISAEAVVSGVACQIAEENQAKYIPFKFSSPININVNTNCQIPENSNFDLKFSTVDAKPMLDADTLVIKCTVSTAYHAYIEPCVRKVRECSIVGDAEYASVSSTVTVYYPDADETLFGIAKKFHTSREKIAADSALSAETMLSEANALSGIKKLMII